MIRYTFAQAGPGWSSLVWFRPNGGFKNAIFVRESLDVKDSFIRKKKGAGGGGRGGNNE